MAKNDINSNFNQIAVSDASDNVWGIRAAVGNVQITGGANGQVLSATAVNGALQWASPSASSTPNFAAYLSTAQTLGASGSWTTILFNTVSYNNGSAYTPVNGRFTAPTAGLYQFESNMYVGGLANLGAHQIAVWKNGAVHRITNAFQITGASYPNMASSNVVTLRLAVGDFVDWRVYANSAGFFVNGAASGDLASWFVGRYISA